MRKAYLTVFLIALTISIAAQTDKEKKKVWQEPWEGVPQHYKKWDYPDFQFPNKLSNWEEERAKTKNTLVQLLGDIPPRPGHLNVRTISRQEMDGFVLEKLYIDNEIDTWIPAYLALPSNAKGKVPVILSMHGMGTSKEDLLNYNTARLLLSHGFAVMAIDNYFNGERLGQGPAGLNEIEDRKEEERSLFKINLWFGRSLWGMMLRDEQIALDYLETRPEIDSERIGVQGMSMGSTRGWWLAAIDDRVKAVVGVACFTRYKELIEQRRLSAHGIYYFVPGMLNHFDTEAVMGLIAPRSFLALTGDSDIGSPLDGMKVLENKLEKVYSLYNAKDHFKSIIYENTGHVYTDEMRQEMLQWFEKHLGTRPLSVPDLISTDFESDQSGTPYKLNSWKADGFDPGWDMGMDERSLIDSSFSVSGSKSLRITYPVGFSGPQRNGAQVSIILPNRDQYYMSYWLRFSENFDFNMGGKLPGLAAGALCSGGGICDGTNGFTARFMWQKGGGAISYLYHMDKPGKWGDSRPLIFPSGKLVNFEKGKWYHIMERVKINSSGKDFDGEVEIWVNNLPVLLQKGLRFTSNGEKVNRFAFSTFHGGSGPDYAPKETCYIWFDDLKISEKKKDVEMPSRLNAK